MTHKPMTNKTISHSNKLVQMTSDNKHDFDSTNERANAETEIFQQFNGQQVHAAL